MPRRDLPFRLPVDARMGVNGGRCGNPPQRYPRKRPTVGAGSSQREDSPAHRNIRIPCPHGNPRMPPPMNPWFLQRRGTPRRYVLREPELPDLNHFTRNKGKAPITHKRLNPYGSFAAVSLLEYGGLKPILPVLRRT